MHSISVVALHTGIDLRSCIYNALVEDVNRSHGVIDTVIDVLGQRDTACRNDNAPRCHTCHSEADFCSVSSLVASGEHELVLLGNLFGDGLCRVIQGVEAVFVGDGIVVNPCSQVVAKRLGYGEDDAPPLNGVALDIVELSVGVGAVVVVQTVEVQSTQQGRGFQTGLGQIGLIDTGGVVLVFDVEAEFLFLSRCGTE